MVANRQLYWGNAAVLNALDYGCTGDGSTDDTTALQTFVTDIVTNGKAGFLPAGNYKITAAIAFPMRPNWSLVGDHRGSTTITQATDNTAIFNLGSDAASQLHTWSISGITFTYTNSQAAANTLANPILFSKMAYQGKLTDCTFSRGSYAIRVASGIGCPWGTTFDNLVFSSGLTLGAMDWLNGVNATPNNHFGRIFCDCANMTGTVFDIRGYNFAIDTVEFVAADQGPILMQFAAGSMVSIGTLKLENGAYTTARALYNFLAGSTATIGHISVGGSSMTASIGASHLRIIETGSSSTGWVECDYVKADFSSAATGTCIVANAGAPVTLGFVQMANGWTLQNNGGTSNGNNLRVKAWQNDKLSDDKGDADYTIALGDPSIAHFQTTLTAQRTITLPSVANNLHNGLYYELVFDGAINGANTAVIKASSGVTLRTQTLDKVVIRYTWRRHATATSGWQLTKYQSLVDPVLASGGGKETLKAHSTMGSTETIDLADGNFHTGTLDAACTLTFAGAVSGAACSFTLQLTQDGTGTWAVTWPAAVKWPAGVAPTLSTGAGKISTLTFYTLDGGTVWRGFLAGDDIR